MNHKPDSIRILVAEDHTLVRQGMLLVLSRDPHLRVVGEAGEGDAAWQLVQALRPDVVVLDLGLPGLDGLDIIQLIKTHALPTRVVVVTARQDPISVRTALARGAQGYLLKSHDAEAFLHSIRVVAAGGHYVAQELAAVADLRANKGVLTRRELQVARDVGLGLTSKEIGARLNISEHTVRKHRENIARKLGLHNAAELVAWAIRECL
ncbi:MAG TPA: response regulator transcription factor [Steroidobacteraceae bacterium]